MTAHGGGKRADRICKQCGKVFRSLLISERQKGQEREHCSMWCYHARRRKGEIICHPPTLKKHTCGFCGVEFDVPLAKGYRKYCSRECCLLGIKQRYKDKPKGKTYRAIRIRSRANNRPPCRICGFKRYVEVCHVVAVANNGKGTEDNLIYLCPNHHKLFDTHNLNKWELGKLDATLMLVYNAGLTQTRFFHHIA